MCEFPKRKIAHEIIEKRHAVLHTVLCLNETGVRGMSIDDFIISVFCLIDDELEKILGGKKLRQRGPGPGLRDSEVITIEIVGEFLGMDCDKTIWEYFKRHWSHFFPKIPDRSNFVRQAANLHVVKRLLQESLAIGLNAFGDTLYRKNLKNREKAFFNHQDRWSEFHFPEFLPTLLTLVNERLEHHRAKSYVWSTTVLNLYA